MSYIVLFFYQGEKEQEKKEKLSNLLPKYPKSICKQSDINWGGTNIHILKESSDREHYGTFKMGRIIKNIKEASRPIIELSREYYRTLKNTTK